MAITVKHTKVSTVPDTADTSLVRPSDWNADHTLTGLGTMAEQDANNVNISGGSISGTTVSGYIPTSEKGANNGVATLDAGGKVPTSQIPLQGDLNYQGTWNATTNTPTLTSSTGTQGYYYVVDVAGSTNLNGITDWQVGDWAIFNGSVWQKVDNTDAVTSVNGQVGTVVLTTTNIAEGTNEYFTQARARQSISAGTGISYNSSTGVITNTSPSLGGDVVGPASATDNAIVRFDTTTGKLIQNSTVTLDDNGNIINANSVGLNTTPATVPTTVGTMSWDDGDGVPTVALKGGNVNLQVGTQEYARVYNDSGATLTKGQAVYISGAQGNRIAVKLARANLEATSFGTIGLVSETIANGAEGFIIVSGALYKLNTTGLTAGATVYLSPTTAGAITTTKPQAPDQLVVLGWVERVDNNVGSIYVKVDNGYELDELHDVQVTSPQSGNLLIYDASTTPIGVWKNAFLTAGTGISVSNGAGSITVTNTAPDQTVVLTAGTGISTSGTYPNFTITNTAPSSGGTVTSVSATTPTGLTVSGSPITGSGTLAFSYTAGYSIPTTSSQANWDTAFSERLQWNGGSTNLVAATGRTSLGGTTVGQNFFTLTNPSAITFPRMNADNTVSSLSAADFRTAIGAGTGNGTVTSVGGTGTVNGISLSGTVTSSGSLTLGGTLSNVSLATQVTGTLPIANGGTGQTTATAAFNALNPMTTTGDILYEASPTTAARLGIGSTGQVLTVSGGLPAWVTPVTAAAGSNTQVQYNNSGALAGSSSFTFASSTLTAPIVSASNGIVVNSNTVSASYTIPAGSSGASAGPITVASGQSVTVSSGSRWVIS